MEGRISLHENFDKFKIKLRKTEIKERLKIKRRNIMIIQNSKKTIEEWGERLILFENCLKKDIKDKNKLKLSKLLYMIRCDLSNENKVEANVCEIIFEKKSILVNIFVNILMNENFNKDEDTVSEIFWIFSIISAIKKKNLSKFLEFPILKLMKKFLKEMYRYVIDSILCCLSNILIEFPQKIICINDLNIFSIIIDSFFFDKKEILISFFTLSNVIASCFIQDKYIMDIFLKIYKKLLKDKFFDDDDDYYYDYGYFLLYYLKSFFKSFLELNIEKDILFLFHKSKNISNIKYFSEIILIYSSQNNICDKFFDNKLEDILLLKTYNENKEIQKNSFNIIQNMILSKQKFIKVLLKDKILDRLFLCSVMDKNLDVRTSALECISSFVFICQKNKKYFDFLIEKNIMDFPFQFFNCEDQLILLSLDFIDKLILIGEKFINLYGTNPVLEHYHSVNIKKKFDFLFEHKNNDIYKYVEYLEKTYFRNN